MPDCVGVILAGGLARRMGGADKPLLEIGGKPILAHVAERLAPQCAALVLNANGDPERFAKFRLPVAADSIEGFAGPLAGVLAGLDYAAANRPDLSYVVSVPGDTPFLPPDLVSRLAQARAAANAQIAVASSAGRVHHAVALWSVALRDELRDAVTQQGERKVSAFVARHPSAAADWPAAPLDPFFNVNRPENLAQAEAMLGRTE